MNLLIPDSWLREYLETQATPEQIKEYLSLCGPSIERITKVGDEIVYTIEITSNRPDSMSVIGVAREAAAILPRFNIDAQFINDPYRKNYSAEIKKYGKFSPPAGASNNKQITIETDQELNPRWTSIIIDGVAVKPSPKWLQQKLELTGIRSLNNIIDITNYVLRTFGQPAHAFDFDEIKPNKKGLPYMKLRSAKNGEKITTLDGKTHNLTVGDIVIEDGSGRLIDLCGIMGARNSSIKPATKAVLLFMQTYNPVNIRKTMMRLSHRTEAGSLFEKGPDAELVLPTVIEGAKLVEELAGGKVVSKLYDIYPKPYQPYKVSVSKNKINAYLGVTLPYKEISKILDSLGFSFDFSNNSPRPSLWKREGVPPLSQRGGEEGLVAKDSIDQQINVAVPSFRRDIEIDVDLIEEIARIYGYHNIKPHLPDGELPIVPIDPTLTWEEEIKIRLRDWGFTETYTYSMISEELMDIFELDKTKVYKISNPLSSEWVYMRPTLTPSMLSALKQNIHLKAEIRLFELSMIYKFKSNDLPKEEPNLLVVWKGDRFLEAKGLAEALFSLFGIPFPSFDTSSSPHNTWYTEKYFKLGEYGAVGIVDPNVLSQIGIKESVTRLYLDVSLLTRDGRITKQYIPIPKYPPIIEDASFILPLQTYVGKVIETIKSISPLVYSVELLGQYETTSTFRINYLDTQKAIGQNEVDKLRQKLVKKITKDFSAQFKGQLKRVEH